MRPVELSEAAARLSLSVLTQNGTFQPPVLTYRLAPAQRMPEFSPFASDERRLDGWKAIAAYLGRTVRTVQRWEREQQLPVHRLLHNSHSTLYAVMGELEQWRRRRSPLFHDEEAAARLSVCLRIPENPGPDHPAALCASLVNYLAGALVRLQTCELPVACGDTLPPVASTTTGPGVDFILYLTVTREPDSTAVAMRLTDAQGGAEDPECRPGRPQTARTRPGRWSRHSVTGALRHQIRRPRGGGKNRNRSLTGSKSAG
jgi:hypothetical protein